MGISDFARRRVLRDDGCDAILPTSTGWMLAGYGWPIGMCNRHLERSA
jgi:hypothetical protein